MPGNDGIACCSLQFFYTVTTCTRFKKLFYFLEYLEYRQTHFAGCFFAKNENMEKFQIVYENHGRTPLEKS